MAIRTALLLSMLVLLTGCAGLVPPLKAYDGAARDMRDLAVIKATTRLASGSTVITIFDGRSGEFAFKEIHALPGKHTMAVRVSDSARMANYNGWRNVAFEAQAGRVYLVHGQLELLQSTPPKGQVFVWITVEGSDLAVAGTPPPPR